MAGTAAELCQRSHSERNGMQQGAPLFFVFWVKKVFKNLILQTKSFMEKPGCIGVGNEPTKPGSSQHPVTTYSSEADSPFQMIKITPNPNTSKKIHGDIYHFNWFSRISSINRRCLRTSSKLPSQASILGGTYLIIQYTNIAGWNIPIFNRKYIVSFRGPPFSSQQTAFFFCDQFPPRDLTPKGSDCKGNPPKMSETFRVRIDNKLPRGCIILRKC